MQGPKQTKSVGKSWCDSVVCVKNPWSSSWWFQPVWKILVKSGSSSPSRDENKKCLKPPPSPVFFNMVIEGKGLHSSALLGGLNQPHLLQKYTCQILVIILSPKTNGENTGETTKKCGETHPPGHVDSHESNSITSCRNAFLKMQVS